MLSKHKNHFRAKQIIFIDQDDVFPNIPHPNSYLHKFLCEDNKNDYSMNL